MMLVLDAQFELCLRDLCWCDIVLINLNGHRMTFSWAISDPSTTRVVSVSILQSLWTLMTTNKVPEFNCWSSSFHRD